MAFHSNTWANGVLLAPPRLIADLTDVVAIDYAWDDAKLGEWTPFAQVRLLITDMLSLKSWSLDVGRQTLGAVIVDQGWQMPANVGIIVQLKAGDKVGKLYSPPYIPEAKVAVRYRTLRRF